MKTLKGRLFPALLGCLFAGLVAFDGAAKIAPDSGRKSLATPHFRVHYPPRHLEFARTLAHHLEEAHALLGAALQWTPRGRIEVVVRGDVDVPLGTAEVFPYNRIVVHAVPPEPWGFFSESDDWIRTLAIHELTHVVANDETSGLFAFLRRFVGTAAKINPYQPAWLVEGLAVYMETRHTTAGRGRSVWNATVLRSALESGRFASEITLDRLNDGVPGWPAGHTPYVFGYLVNETIAGRAGPGGPAAISSANSSHLPFVIDRVARGTVGADYAELWRAAVDRLRFDVARDRAKIAREPVTRSTRATTSGRLTRGPVSIGAKTYFIRDSERSGPGLSVRDESGQLRDLEYWRWNGGTRLEATADERYLVYSRVGPYLEHSLFSDLYLYDVARGREIAVTAGARGFDPVPSPDFRWDTREGRVAGGSLYYVKYLGDGNAAIAAWNGDDERVLYAGKNFERLGAPAFGMKEWLVFAEKPRDGGERLRALRISDGRVFTLLEPRERAEIATTPGWAPNGDLVFSGGRGGVLNAFRIPAESVRAALASGTAATNVGRVTNSDTGVLQPRVRGDGVWEAIVYGADGWDVASLDGVSSSRGYSPAGPGVSRFAPDPAPVPEKRSTPAVSDAAVPATYSVLPALWPHYWAPDVRRVPEGWTLGVQTSSFDAWEAHRYRLFAGADTRANFPIWNVNYQFDGLFPTFEYSFRQENRYFANYGESNRILTHDARVYTPAGWHSYLVLGFTAQTTRFFEEKETTGGFQIGWTFDRMRTFDDSVDRRGEFGMRGGAELTGYFAGAERFSSLASRLELRLPSFFPRHFFRWAANHATANNERIGAHYELGGGEETIAADRFYLLRGYVPGTIFGREILTSNLEYVFPVADVFRGPGTFPLFWQTTRVKLFADTGAAEYLGDAKDDSTHWPIGAGLHVLTDVNLLYRVPVTLGVGVDHGFSKRHGGETRFVLGLFSTLARP